MILRSFEQLAAYAAAQIRYTAAPVADILAAAAHDRQFAVLRGFLTRFGENKAWRESFASGLQQELAGQGLRPEDTALITAWGEGLGSTDMEGQTEHCRQFGERLKEQAEAARQQALIKGKLYTSLGLAGGLTMVLIWL